ncbi:KRAB-A domain-containing 2-like [Brachionus plicatilis]|uniref:KRAB-A domain-containing 2-like n=1 Tax=Brachionus plicatilis TaxID=10195 RepID=A0A3M7RZP5_BRAPC|nr:KRAB-A domain-containing 2-like [Brachionus plicatilis]
MNFSTPTLSRGNEKSAYYHRGAHYFVDNFFIENKCEKFYICNIVSKKKIYELACQFDVFLDLFFRNAFDLVQICQIELEIRTDKSIKSVRQTVNEMSIGGGQGMVRCNCTSQCITNRCGYRKSNLLCNCNCNLSARCHG